MATDGPAARAYSANFSGVVTSRPGRADSAMKHEGGFHWAALLYFDFTKLARSLRLLLAQLSAATSNINLRAAVVPKAVEL